MQKTYFDTELKKIDDKISSNSSKKRSYEHKLKQREDTIKDLERDASYFSGKRFFDHDGYQNYLVFQLLYEYLKRVVFTNNKILTIFIHSWTSKGLSNEKITAPGTSNNNGQF